MPGQRRRFVVTLRAIDDAANEDLETIEVHELDRAIEEFVEEEAGVRTDSPDLECAVEVGTEEVFE